MDFFPYAVSMKYETALFWWHLGILTRKRYTRLRDVFGSIDDVPTDVSCDFLRELGLKPDMIEPTLERAALFGPEQCVDAMQKRTVGLMTIEDEAYPSLLKQIPDAPVFLSYIGDTAVLRQPMIAVVGTRDMTAVGRQIVGHFIPDFVRSGVVTVSGLAFGVDAEVARRTMEYGGRTVAALGGGLASISPADNRTLADRIVEQGGILLSEFPLSFQPDIYTFPARNRIIAGLSLGTLVIEAPEQSGAIITAELAADYNRDVFAVPGVIFAPTFRGCNRLIGTGQAQLVCEAQDVLSEVGIMASNRAESKLFIPANVREESVYSRLTSMPQTMDDLVIASGMNASDVAAALTMMEVSGGVKNVGGGQWVRN